MTRCHCFVVSPTTMTVHGWTLKNADRATFAIIDGAVEVTWQLRTPPKCEFRLLRQVGFLRCAAVLYEGPATCFQPEQLARFKVSFAITVRPRPVRHQEL